MILYWRTSHQMPGASDLVIYLLAMPLGILFIYWTAKVLFLKIKNPKSKDFAAIVPEKEVDDSEAKLTLVLLASAVRSSAGNAPEEILQAIREEHAAPQLDKHLTDSNGFPVLTGRIADIDEAAAADRWSEWFVSKNHPAHTWSQEQLRAMDLGSSVAMELIDQLIAHELINTYQMASDGQKENVRLPTLHLQTLLPPQWTGIDKQLANAWLVDQIVEAGWPKEKLSVREMAKQDQQDFSPLAQLDRLILESHRLRSTDMTLMMACESFIGEQTIEQWETSNRLMSSKNTKGHIPGEGAAAILLSTASTATTFSLEKPVLLHRAARKFREKSIEASGVVSGELVVDLCVEACAAAGIAADAVKLVSSDTGNHPNRMAELLQAVQTHLPDIAPNEQVANVVTACGNAGIVSTLTALVLAHGETRTTDQHTLCISNQHPQERLAVIISPLTPVASA